MKNMSKHFILGLVLALICLRPLHAQTATNTPAATPSVAGISVNAAQGGQPSFDCRKAASVSENTICGNAELSRLDFQLGRTWKTLLDGFIDDAQRTQMKQDQKTWIARREKCAGDANCIGELYRDRLSALNGTDPAHRFSGVYEVKDIGLFALYPIGNRYLIHIQTADPRDGRWECDLNGEAESSGDDLDINVDRSVFQAHLQDTKTLVVSNTDSTSKAASLFCGLNGTFAFSYLRVHPNP
ncbi:MAG: lysozyme inhibitor LprI family protein [Acidobacteriia bacterium]|nr:lysozyme inhibitor LprI family protein [Terriglobia bacterium]